MASASTASQHAFVNFVSAEFEYSAPNAACREDLYVPMHCALQCAAVRRMVHGSDNATAAGGIVTGVPSEVYSGVQSGVLVEFHGDSAGDLSLSDDDDSEESGHGSKHDVGQDDSIGYNNNGEDDDDEDDHGGNGESGGSGGSKGGFALPSGESGKTKAVADVVCSKKLKTDAESGISRCPESGTSASGTSASGTSASATSVLTFVVHGTLKSTRIATDFVTHIAAYVSPAMPIAAAHAATAGATVGATAGATVGATLGASACATAGATVGATVGATEHTDIAAKAGATSKTGSTPAVGKRDKQGVFGVSNFDVSLSL